MKIYPSEQLQVLVNPTHFKQANGKVNYFQLAALSYAFKLDQPHQIINSNQALEKNIPYTQSI